MKPDVQNIERSFSFYPSPAEVDAWAARLLDRSEGMAVEAALCDCNPIRVPFGNSPNTLVNRYVRFAHSSGHVFYGYWQPAHKTPAPLLINLPGYGGSISLHPQVNDDGYHILHISPLGYVTPEAVRRELAMEDGNWPVLHNTAMGLAGGYEDWLCDCLLAVRWALEQPDVMRDRLSLFGTSQGGGGALLLASLLGKKIRCVCADLPFLTAFPLTGLQGEAYGILQKASAIAPEQAFWNRLGYVDTVSHTHRLHVPVMLSAGGKDIVCPPETAAYLFERLHCTKQLTYLQEGVHTHSRESMYLFRAWLQLFA